MILRYTLHTALLRRLLIFMAGTGLLFLPASANPPSIIINEVMASNSATIADGDGDFEDWVELYNFGTEPVHLKGYGLSDDYDDLFRWSFPDVKIAPGDYLLVWASGKNRNDPAGELHTGFSISSAGEEVVLAAPDGTVIDALEPVNIPTDISIGRKSGDLSAWYFFNDPTPGAANTTTAWKGIQDPPVFSHQRGFYDAPFALSLDGGSDDVRIYYTLDGSEPDSSNVAGSIFVYKNSYPYLPGSSPGPFLERAFLTYPYTDPIPVTDRTGEEGIYGINTSFFSNPLVPQADVLQGVVVRAKAYRNGYLPSEVASHTFLVREDIGARFDIPVIAVTVPDSSLFDYYRGIYVAGVRFDEWREDNPSEEVWPGVPANWGRRGMEWEHNAHFELFDPQGAAELAQNLGVRIHGGWSRSTRKKSLRFYARNVYDTGNEVEHILFPGQGRELDDTDTGTFKRFLLRAGGNSNDMLRDVASLDLVRNTSIGVQRARPVAHFVNGVYWGLMHIRDRQDRYHIAWEYDIDPDNVIMINSPYQITGENRLEEGVPEDLDYFNDFYRFVTQNDMSRSENLQVVREMIDLDSYIDYYISFIYLANTDWGGSDNVGAKHFRFWRVRNTSLKPYQDGKWRMLVWDFDSGFRDYNQDLLTDVMNPENEPSEILLSLMENEWFAHRFINRMADLMNSHFRPDRARSVIDSIYRVIENEIPHCHGRWNRHPAPTYDHMLNFVEGRPSRQRREMMNVFGLPDTSTVRLRTNPARGYVRINTVDITDRLPGVEDPGDWNGVYFHGVPVTIEAVPRPGMVFSHWEGLPGGTPAKTSINLIHDTTLTAHFWDGVVHYWHFNNLPDDDFVETVHPDYSLFPDEALLFYPGSGDGYMYRAPAGTCINAHMGAEAGYALGVYHPDDSRPLLFNIPADGQQSLHFSYALRRSYDGPGYHSVDLSFDNGASWVPVEEGIAVTGHYTLHRHDLSSFGEATNTSGLMLRIRFYEQSALSGPGDAVYFDNIVLKEAPLELADEQPEPGQVDSKYSFRLKARYGSPPYVFDRPEGSLPPGIELSDDGLLSGIPSREGSYPFTVRITDNQGRHASHTYVLTIYHDALVHYWHFNDLPDNAADTVPADYSVTDSSGSLHYHGTGQGYMDAVEGTVLNQWSGVPGGLGLRVRNPSNVRELRFTAPSTGYNYLRLSYAVTRTANGARWQLLQYSPDGGGYWRDVEPPYRITTDYQVRTFDLRYLPGTADNPELMFRILFLGPEASNMQGNNRFDNISLRGLQATADPERDELFVFPNPVTGGVIYFLKRHSIRIYDMYGRFVLSEEDTMRVELAGLAQGLYIIVTDDGRHAKIIIP